MKFSGCILQLHLLIQLLIQVANIIFNIKLASSTCQNLLIKLTNDFMTLHSLTFSNSLFRNKFALTVLFTWLILAFLLFFCCLIWCGVTRAGTGQAHKYFSWCSNLQLQHVAATYHTWYFRFLKDKIHSDGCCFFLFCLSGDICKYAVHGASTFSICQHGLLLTVVKPTLQWDISLLQTVLLDLY